MSWFRRKKKPETALPSTLSYRERVDHFWDWWTTESDRIYQSVESNGGASIQPEVSEAVSNLSPDLGWVFGPGPDGEGHSFTISPGGIPSRCFLVDYWYSKVPQLEGWTFYPSRQASHDPGVFKVRMGKVEVTAASLWLTPQIDLENEAIDIVAWSPLFAEIDENEAITFLFLLLDDALGEDIVSRCIGAIEIGDGKLTESIPVSELPEFVDDTFEKHHWSQDRTWGCTYNQDGQEGDFPRSDIFVGSTRDIDIIRSYNSQRGPFEHPLSDSGVDLIFLQLPAAILPEENAVHFRGTIEDALDERLDFYDSGHVFGGAMGSSACYIDLVLFDGSRGRKAIKEVMSARGFSGQYQIFPFTES